ncbi:hypothetical protein [Prevotella jejuni]|uniref:hypothetical protein n=1 Tax=Prevotella jejuni TaxID=1177574 RepID=UPI0028DC2675|nr:hypothetical protein [Prevotella jejuni]
MDWQVAIDIKAWKSDFHVLENVLSYAKAKPWIKVLFSESLHQFISIDNENSWAIYKMFVDVAFEPYTDRPNGTNMKYSPDISNGLSQQEDEETGNATYSMLHHGEPSHKIYEMAVGRPNGATDAGLSLTDGTLSKNVDLIITSNNQSLELFFVQNHPKLQQAKHISQQTRNLGRGKVASTFKAWNPNDESYAIELLDKAFADTGSPTLPPTPIYTWDSRNENYVKFMHSGNWEYHGYDLENFSEVPSEIRKRYNHWKK